MEILSYIEKANHNFDSFIFESGQCHTLALALTSLFKGKLIAIIRTNEDEGITTYSHMVAEIDNCLYDINGENADERWCDAFSENNEFDYQEINPENLNDFLKNWNCSIDTCVLDKLNSL